MNSPWREVLLSVGWSLAGRYWQPRYFLDYIASPFIALRTSYFVVSEYWSDGFSPGIRCAKLCGGSHLRPLEDSARGSDSTQLQRGQPSSQLQVRQVSEDLLLWGLPDRHEMLLVWHHRPHLLSLLLLRRDAGLQIRSAGANLPASHRGVHTKNSDLPGQLHWRQDKREHPSIRVITYRYLYSLSKLFLVVVSIPIWELDCTYLQSTCLSVLYKWLLSIIDNCIQIWPREKSSHIWRLEQHG